MKKWSLQEKRRSLYTLKQYLHWKMGHVVQELWIHLYGVNRVQGVILTTNIPGKKIKDLTISFERRKEGRKGVEGINVCPFSCLKRKDWNISLQVCDSWVELTLQCKLSCLSSWIWWGGHIIFIWTFFKVEPHFEYWFPLTCKMLISTVNYVSALLFYFLKYIFYMTG